MHGGQGDGQQVGLCREDVVVDIEEKLLLLREQQVQILKHLRQEERVHPENKHGANETLGTTDKPVLHHKTQDLIG